MAKGMKSAKQASETFHNIMKASVSGNPKPPDLAAIKKEYLSIVKDQPVSKTWPQHLIYDIKMVDGVPHVFSRDENDSVEYCKKLHTWLFDNGY
jgi:hypothetical protein